MKIPEYIRDFFILTKQQINLAVTQYQLTLNFFSSNFLFQYSQ